MVSSDKIFFTMAFEAVGFIGNTSIFKQIKIKIDNKYIQVNFP